MVLFLQVPVEVVEEILDAGANFGNLGVVEDDALFNDFGVSPQLFNEVGVEVYGINKEYIYCGKEYLGGICLAKAPVDTFFLSGLADLVDDVVFRLHHVNGDYFRRSPGKERPGGDTVPDAEFNNKVALFNRTTNHGKAEVDV